MELLLLPFIRKLLRDGVGDVLSHVDSWLRRNGSSVPTGSMLFRVSRALQQHLAGPPPRIAIVGKTSTGKSTLFNCLFNHPASRIAHAPGTTTDILRAELSTGLALYDTPGLFDNVQDENFTRQLLSLEIEQADEETADRSPRRNELLSWNYERREWADARRPEERDRPDVVILLVDLFSIPVRHEKAVYKALVQSLVKRYGTQLVIAGSKIDEFVNDSDRRAAVALWSQLSGRDIFAVSSKTGEGFPELVEAIFRAVPGQKSLRVLQDGLRREVQLARCPYVVMHVSRLLAEIAMLDTTRAKELRDACVCLFVLLGHHYAVSEVRSSEFQDDAQKIARRIGRRSVFDALRWLVLQPLWHRSDPQQFGRGALDALLPKVYATICEYEHIGKDALSNEKVLSYLQESPEVAAALGERSDEAARSLSSALAGILSTLIHDTRSAASGTGMRVHNG